MAAHTRSWGIVPVADAAQALGVTPRTVRRWLQHGILAGAKLGTAWGVWWPETGPPQGAPAAAVRARLRHLGGRLITIGNQVAAGQARRGKVFLTWRRPRGVQVTLAIGRHSATQGWAPYALGVELPFWLRERQTWHPVLSLLRRYERLRHWSHPRLLRLPGVAVVIYDEAERLDAALAGLAVTVAASLDQRER